MVVDDELSGYKKCFLMTHEIFNWLIYIPMFIYALMHVQYLHDKVPIYQHTDTLLFGQINLNHTQFTVIFKTMNEVRVILALFYNIIYNLILFFLFIINNLNKESNMFLKINHIVYVYICMCVQIYKHNIHNYVRAGLI